MSHESNFASPPEKGTLRAACRERRAALDSSERADFSRRFAEHFLNNVVTHGKTVAAYCAFRDELDTRPLLNALDDHGIACCLPVVDPSTSLLAFRRWTPDTTMILGAFGVPEPDPDTSEIVAPDILIVPLLGFDATGHRLGYGAGCYDRTLERLRQDNPNLQLIGAAFSCQQVDSIPAEAHDQALNLIITENGPV